MYPIKKLMVIMLIGIMMIPFAGINSIALNIDVTHPEHVEGMLLVQFEENFPEQGQQAILDHANAKAIEQLDNKGLVLVEYNTKRPIHTVINQLENMNGVLFAEPDYMLYPIEITEKSTFVDPSDETYYDLLWGLHNTGQNILGTSGVEDVDIDAPEAWNITAGSSDIIVAVIDTAIDLNHPDLQGKIIDYQKFHRGREDKSHGTHVAGTISANDNDIGVVGVAPDVKIMGLAFLGYNGGSTSDAIKAINYAAANGADIINASWGGGAYNQSLYDAIENFNGPFVAAAGNDGYDNDTIKHYPSSYTNSNVISVAAIDNLGQLADFSNYGASDVDIGAPGVDIASTYPGGYAWMGGTSMATPHVTGILALMKSYSPTSTTSDLIDALYSSGDDKDSLDGVTVTGKMANAYAALNALDVTPPINTPPTVIIESPLEGSEFYEGENITFNAVIDDEDIPSTSVVWTSNTDLVIGSEANFSRTLDLGVHEIEVVVTDKDGLTGNDTVTITVIETTSNTPPTVSITSPENYSTFPEGTIISFTANASDAEDDDLSGQVVWSSDIDGTINDGVAELSVGTHTVTASVTDSGGLSASDTITVTIESVPSVGETIAEINYSTEGGRKGDAHLLITFILKDGENPVDGANLSVDVLLNDNYLRSFSGTTSGGQVTFKITNANSGTYSISELVIDSTPPWKGTLLNDPVYVKQ